MLQPENGNEVELRPMGSKPLLEESSTTADEEEVVLEDGGEMKQSQAASGGGHALGIEGKSVRLCPCAKHFCR